MHQPALVDNLVCMHLGGAKEVKRWHNGRLDVHDVSLGAMTIMPANQTNRWLTRGPIDFAHLTMSPALLSQVALEEFDRDGSSFQLVDVVGFRDPGLEHLFTALLNAIEHQTHFGRLYPDSLLVVLTVELLGQHSHQGRARSTGSISKGGLAPWRLQRVIDYMTANLGSDVGLADLTALTGLSRAQFYRGFKQSTGTAPHHYLTDLRISAAKSLLRGGHYELPEIAMVVGVGTEARLRILFRQRVGITLREYQKSC